MIPILRIHFDRERARQKICYGLGDFSPKSAVEFAIDKFAKRVSRNIYRDEYIKMTTRYANMVSGNVPQTLRSFIAGYGAYRLLKNKYNKSWYYGFEIEHSLIGDSKAIYTRLCDRKEINHVKEDMALTKHRMENMFNRYLPKKSKFFSLINFCEKCGKCHKTSARACSGYCKSCCAKDVHFYKKYNELNDERVEVNRLINKLKRVIKDEVKRIESEAGICD